MAGEEAVGLIDSPRKKARAGVRAGYRQVIELMRQGCGVEEILARLRMRPARLREIMAGRPFRRIVELEQMAIAGSVALRLRDKAGKAASLLARAAESDDPKVIYKAAMAVINLATRPLPRPPPRPSGMDLEASDLAAGRMGGGMSDLQRLPLEDRLDALRRAALGGKDHNA